MIREFSALPLFYKILIVSIVTVKLGYLGVVTMNLLSNLDVIKLEDFDTEEYKEKMENLYFFLMSIMIVYIFCVPSSRRLSSIERELLHVFGWVLMYSLFSKFIEKRTRKNKKDSKTSNSSDVSSKNENTNNDTINDIIEELIDFFVPAKLL